MQEIRKQVANLSPSHKALIIAKYAHADQVRKGTAKPYIIHPYSVYGTLLPHTNDEATLAAALLHDVLEDVDPTRYSEQHMREDFGDDIVTIVKLVTKDKTITNWRQSNQAYLDVLWATNDHRALLVSASDKLDNLTTSLHDHAKEGDTFWARFHAGKEEQKWWYGSIATLLQAKIPDHPLVPLYIQKVDELSRR